MNTLSATEVRKNWSLTLDSVIRNRPAYIKRTRDNVALSDVNTLISLILGGTADADTLRRADVNSDGEINISDVNKVMDIILN